MAVKEKPKKIEEIVKEIENTPIFKQLPQEMKDLVKKSLESANEIKLPITMFKENDWVIAATPFIDVCAQGKSEEEAVECLREMLEDYMTDPDTVKPKIESMVNVEMSIRTIPIKFPINQSNTVVSNAR